MPLRASYAVECAVLPRYRFDSTEQVSRHFRLATGRVVLFYPAALPLRYGEPVILDVTFGASDQHCPLRGTVLAKESASQSVGLWLEFAAHGLVASLRSAGVSLRRFGGHEMRGRYRVDHGRDQEAEAATAQLHG